MDIPSLKRNRSRGKQNAEAAEKLTEREWLTARRSRGSRAGSAQDNRRPVRRRPHPRRREVGTSLGHSALVNRGVLPEEQQLCRTTRADDRGRDAL